MAIDIYKDQMQHAQLFGKPVLTTSWRIPRVMVPDGWSCYDMSGTDQDVNAHARLADYASFCHNGTVLSPEPLKDPADAFRQINNGDYLLQGEVMDLETFCKEYNLALPARSQMKEELENVLLEECVRRWFDMAQDEPALSEGTGFAAFCREMSYELLADHEFMEDYYHYIVPEQSPPQMDEPSF